MALEKLIYADHNATTPVGPAAKAAMIDALDAWGNPSSSHGIGRRANGLLEQARKQVAGACGVPGKEVVFTSGGSESNAQAILGMHFLIEELRVVTADTEHSSVRDSIAFLVKRGAKVEKVRILPSGDLDMEHFEALLAEKKPQLVSLMAANNETGVTNPTLRIRQLCTQYGSVYHCDAVQAFGKVPADQWNTADLISVSSHKIYGPKGVGALIVRNGIALVPLPFGGTQEVKRRGGTQNMVGIIGFGAAASEIADGLAGERMSALRNRFETKLAEQLPGVTVNGAQAVRVCNTSNVRFPGIISEVLLSILDLEGVCVSAGSACSSGSILPSPVLLAMGLTRDEARECVRFSWGRDTTESDIDSAAHLVIQHVERIRSRKR